MPSFSLCSKKRDDSPRSCLDYTNPDHLILSRRPCPTLLVPVQYSTPTHSSSCRIRTNIIHSSLDLYAPLPSVRCAATRLLLLLPTPRPANDKKPTDSSTGDKINARDHAFIRVQMLLESPNRLILDRVVLPNKHEPARDRGSRTAATPLASLAPTYAHT